MLVPAVSTRQYPSSPRAVYNHWTGLVDWTGGLDWWTGLVDWTGGLDWWTGLVDWTGGVTLEIIFMLLMKLTHL